LIIQNLFFFFNKNKFEANCNHRTKFIKYDTFRYKGLKTKCRSKARLFDSKKVFFDQFMLIIIQFLLEKDDINRIAANRDPDTCDLHNKANAMRYELEDQHLKRLRELMPKIKH
jgi:hypothetical protein